MLVGALLVAMVVSLPLAVFVMVLFSEGLADEVTTLSCTVRSFRLKRSPRRLSVVALPRPTSTSGCSRVSGLKVAFRSVRRAVTRGLGSVIDLSVGRRQLGCRLLRSRVGPRFLCGVLKAVQAYRTLNGLSVTSRVLAGLATFCQLALEGSGRLVPVGSRLRVTHLCLRVRGLYRGSGLG